MSDKLVTLLTYEYLHRAELARSVLEEIGIKSFVADGNIVLTNWFLSTAVGFIKLQVRAVDADAALEYLRNNPVLMAPPRSKRRPPDADAACLACRHAMTEDQSICPACGWSFGEPSSDA